MRKSAVAFAFSVLSIGAFAGVEGNSTAQCDINLKQGKAEAVVSRSTVFTICGLKGFKISTVSQSQPGAWSILRSATGGVLFVSPNTDSATTNLEIHYQGHVRTSTISLKAAAEGV